MDETRQAMIDAMRARVARHSLDHGAASWARSDQHLGQKRRKPAEESDSDDAIELDEIRRAEERLGVGGGDFIDPALLEGESEGSDAEQEGQGETTIRAPRYAVKDLLGSLLEAREKLGILLPAASRVVEESDPGTVHREVYLCQLLKAKLVLVSYCIAELRRTQTTGGRGDDHPCFSHLEQLDRELERTTQALLAGGSDEEDGAAESDSSNQTEAAISEHGKNRFESANASSEPLSSAEQRDPERDTGPEGSSPVSANDVISGEETSDSVSLEDIDLARELEREEQLRQANAGKAAADLLGRTESAARREELVSGDTMPVSFEDRVLMRREAVPTTKEPSKEASGRQPARAQPTRAQPSDSEESTPPRHSSRSAPGGRSNPGGRPESQASQPEKEQNIVQPRPRVYDPNSDILKAKPGAKELSSRPELAGKRMATPEIVKGLPDLRRAKSKKKSTARKSIRRRYERAQGVLHGIHGKPREPEYMGYKGEKGGIDSTRSRSQKLGY